MKTAITIFLIFFRTINKGKATRNNILKSPNNGVANINVFSKNIIIIIIALFVKHNGITLEIYIICSYMIHAARTQRLANLHITNKMKYFYGGIKLSFGHHASDHKLICLS